MCACETDVIVTYSTFWIGVLGLNLLTNFFYVLMIFRCMETFLV